LSETEHRLAQLRAVRQQLHERGPARSRPFPDDFARVGLPRPDCDALRDMLIAENAKVVVEVGLAYGGSALAISEALLRNDGAGISHVVIDPFQESSYSNVGWDTLREAGVHSITQLIIEPSSIALARLVADGLEADAAFVDGSHRFHEVFVDLYYVRKLVRPGGLVILDDTESPSVGTALRYFELNLGWKREPLGSRLVACRLPSELIEPAFTDFKPFS
jgi:predicted O-methyltransferase YrrM